jgi:DNA-binding GntR family transcriptional regulator
MQPLATDALRVSTLREQVADLIRRAIVEMRLKPGDRLVERELIEWTGVSRATIREAIRELATEGLVRTIPQKGAVVASPSLREAAEVYEVRAALEGLAGRLFAERADTAQREALARSYQAIREVLGSGADTWSMLEAKNSFYAVLLAGADNAAMVSMLGLLQARITMLRATSMTQPGRAAEAIAEIGDIVRAIEARDGDAAATACAFHVQRAGHYALTALSEAAASEPQPRPAR